MRTVYLIRIVFILAVFLPDSCINRASAQLVPDLVYPLLCDNTGTKTVPQRPTETNNKHLSFQEEGNNEKERTHLYTPDIVKEKIIAEGTQESLLHNSENYLKIGYKKGLYLKTTNDRFTLKTSLRFQLRYEIDDFEDQEDTSSLTIRRGRIALKGNLFGDQMKYFFQLDAHSTGKQSEISTLQMIDYNTDINIIPFAKIRLGQDRLPSNRQWLTPDSKLQMVDFSIASSEFNLDRQLGVMVHDKYFSNKLECNLGFYTGYYDLFDVDYREKNEWLGIARLSYNPFGSFGYSESDVEFSESPLFHVSGSASFNSKDNVSFNLRKLGKLTPDHVESTLFVQESGFKYKGFSVLEEFYCRRREFMSRGITDLGWFVQGGYFVRPKKIEITARYSRIDFDDDRKDNSKSEGTMGVNYFFSGHRNKLQLNAVRLDHDSVSDESTDYKFLLQFQYTL